MKAVVLSCWLVAVAMLAASPVAAQRSASPPVSAYNRNAVLYPGDVLRVTVWKNPDMSGDFTVGINGTLEHPLYQAVHVAGIPLAAVQDSLRNYLKRFEANPQFVAVPLFRVTVSGAVAKPGLYSLPRPTTISQAIATAGGVAATGQLNKVRIVRGGQEIEADLTRADARWANEPIQSGDQIVVKAKGSFWTTIFLPAISVVGAVASIINISSRR